MAMGSPDLWVTLGPWLACDLRQMSATSGLRCLLAPNQHPLPPTPSPPQPAVTNSTGGRNGPPLWLPDSSLRHPGKLASTWLPLAGRVLL